MESFGPLKAVYVARDDERPGSNKGYGFCEYVDGTKTDPAIAGLDGLAIGEGRKLSVRRASTKNPKCNIQCREIFTLRYGKIHTET